MINCLECTIRLRSSIEGEPTPIARVKFNTPEGKELISFVKYDRDFPDDTYSWLIGMQLIMCKVTKDYEEAYRKGEAE